MRRAALLLLLAGCTEVVTSTPDPVEPAEPACDGSRYAEVCRGYWPGYRYGIPDECTSSPWQPVEAGAPVSRVAGRRDCERFSQSSVTCCPE